MLFLCLNFFQDFKLYCKHSNVFTVNNLLKKEAKLILNYHSLEKGMLFNELKLGYGKDKVIKLNEYLNDDEIIKNITRSQILVAYQVMCKYYEIHKNNGHDISDFYSINQYNKYKSLLDKNYTVNFNGAIDYDFNTFYSFNDSNFELFAKSRKSIRSFTGRIVPKSLIYKAIDLALTAPSVCNRQASKVYLIEDKKKIDDILEIQGGFRGYSKSVHQLLIVSNDRNYYYNIGERNQFYIDGGLFLMNLLYSLHFYKIANCPANWGKTIDSERRLDGIINIEKSEKIICLIPIGIAEQRFRVTLSKRRNVGEILTVIN